MKQIIQNIHNGKLKVVQVPDPLVRPGQVLIANISSVISSGTERMVMDLARKSLLGKAKCATKIQYFGDPLLIINSSLPRRRESSNVMSFWIPAFAGMTFLEVAFIQCGVYAIILSQEGKINYEDGAGHTKDSQIA